MKPELIAADYELSTEPLRALFAAMPVTGSGRPPRTPTRPPVIYEADNLAWLAASLIGAEVVCAWWD